MASIQPPTAANLKRKRAPADSLSSSQPSIPSHLRDTINPRSHSQSTLKQLQAAGLSDHDVLPSDIVPGFPHRSLPNHLFNQDNEDGAEIPADIDRSKQQGALSDVEDDDDGAESGKDQGDPAAAARRRAEKRERGVKRALRAHERHLGVLTTILHRSLDGGDLARAKRAFALLARSEIYGKAVDLRQDHLWAVGAEILMREGEEQEQQRQEQEEQGSHRDRKRWGSAANMPRVRAYYQDLILHHPYNRMFPRATSALDFWPALLGTELYNAWAEHGLALRRLEADAEEWAAGGGPETMDYSEDDDDINTGDRGGKDDDRVLKMGPWEARLREAKDNLRTEIMVMVRDIARKMDGLMENPPYSTSHEMLRLRGMVSLYLSDLVMAPAPRSAREDRDGRVEREEEREKAKDAFRKIIKERGEVEEWIEHFVYPERMEDEEDEEATPVFSSLPLR